MSRARVAAAVGVALALLFTAAGAAAQAAPDSPELSEQQQAEYRALVREALQEYDLGHWEEARSLMLAAHELSPSARTLRALGMVAFERRDYVDAADLLERALEDDRKPLTETQRAAVHELLERTRHFLGRYRLDVQPERPEDIEVFVDGAPAHLDARGRVVLEAGEHELLVEAPELGRQTLMLDVRGGEEVTLEIRLAGRQGADDPSAQVEAVETAPTAETRPYRGWGMGFGVGGVSVAAVGAVLGGVALGKAGSADSDAGGDADSARALARGADVLLAVGGVAAVAGLSLWLVRGERPAEQAGTSLELTPVVARGSGGLVLSGSF